MPTSSENTEKLQFLVPTPVVDAYISHPKSFGDKKMEQNESLLLISRIIHTAPAISTLTSQPIRKIHPIFL
jgi:hypothetical protein